MGACISRTSDSIVPFFSNPDDEKKTESNNAVSIDKMNLFTAEENKLPVYSFASASQPKLVTSIAAPAPQQLMYQSNPAADYQSMLDALKKECTKCNDDGIFWFGTEKYDTIVNLKWGHYNEKTSSWATDISPGLLAIINEDLAGIEQLSEGHDDMTVIRYIRMLYATKASDYPEPLKSKYIELRKRIIRSIGTYPFFPAAPEFGGRNLEHIEFWTENHLIMHLSSGYLYYQIDGVTDGLSDNDKSLAKARQDVVTKYFLKWFELHENHFFNGGGVYEVLSHTYLYLTMIALLNVMDYAQPVELQTRAEKMVDWIVKLLAYAVDPISGISTFSGNSL
jgi:hypothetical protein